MGSWKEERYQKVLEKVETEMLAGKTVPARVVFQPNNLEDINAVEVDAFIQNSWKIVGNIKKREIPKLTVALRRNKVTNVKFRGKPKYKININNSAYRGLMCWLTITRSGKWGKDDEDYRYSKDLSHL